MITIRENAVISFRYTNHRDETKIRVCRFLAVDYGHNEWYPEDQFFLRCIDLERDVIRSFAINNIEELVIRP